MIERVIIADDLTGALDAAAPFAARGIRTVVALGIQSLGKAIASGARIVSVSTDSREMSPQNATSAVRAAIAALPAGTPIFKKVDSRLKGNIEAELDAIPHAKSLVAPAIPDFGRVVREGRVAGFGVEVPIDIAARLGRHARTAFIPDVSTVEEMARALDHPHDLAIGARGLAEAMVQRMAPASAGAPIVLPGGNAYCIIGSTDPITMAQIDDLRRARPDMTDLPAPNGVASSPIVGGGLTLLQSVPGAKAADAKAVASALGASLVRLSPQPGDLLVISGGATAQIVLEALGLDVLILLGEVQPGLPIAHAGGLTVVTKSGGFGERDCLSRLFTPYANARSPVQSHVG